MRYLLIFLCACSFIKEAGGEVAGTIGEYTLCPIEAINCGHVFQCTGTMVDTPSGFVEICIDDDDQPEQLDSINSIYGDCSPTPRHEGLCSYCCGPSCGRGCNAFSGCFCQ